ncbi:hypothetical protein J4050_14305, partial [Winogradskyella sp. DF17]|nr:hypothetical protein [Winogradskyella sp. DF17]
PNLVYALNRVESEIIANYLNDNQCSQEAQGFALPAIDAIVEGLNSDVEIILYVIENEQNYRDDMSSDELAFFDTLSTNQQLGYLVSAEEAKRISNELFETFCERYNGKGDAFRHAYWNILSSIRIGVYLTSELTTRHENISFQYAFHGKEVEMDLYNNNIGRSFVENGIDNLLLARQTIQTAFDNGDLRYLNNQDGSCRATFSSVLTPTNE